jgi:hypothetical protein
MRRRIIRVTSSSNEISTDKLGNRVVVREGGVTLPAPAPFYCRLLDKYVKTTCTGFLLPLDICFIGKRSYTTQKDVSHVTTLYTAVCTDQGVKGKATNAVKVMRENHEEKENKAEERDHYCIFEPFCSCRSYPSESAQVVSVPRSWKEWKIVFSSRNILHLNL